MGIGTTVGLIGALGTKTQKELDTVKSAITSLDYVNFIASNHLTVTGYRIQTNGKPTTSSGYNASPFIPVKAGTKIKAGMYCSNMNCVLAYYTTNEGNPEATYTVVGAGSSVNNITETEYTVPNNGFIRFCSSNSKSGEYLYFENMESDADRMNFEKRIENAETKLSQSFNSSITGLTYTNGYIDSDGSVHTATANKEIISDEIYSAESIDFSISFGSSQSIWVAFASYGINGTLIGSRQTYSETGTSKSGTYTVPTGALYSRISFRTFDAAYTLSMTGHYNPIVNSRSVGKICDDRKANSSRDLIVSQLKPCYDHLFVTTYGENIVIPCQSLYHLRISKSLGFNCIEANVSATSDGVFFVHHLEDDGTFGRYFHHVDGETDISAIKASEVTWVWIAENVRYNSTVAKYRTRPVLLSEFLQECKKQEIIPFVTSSSADVVSMVEGIMGKNNFVAYRGTRLISPTAIIYQWRSYETKQEIIDYCDKFGTPFIYGMSNINSFTDEQLADIISSMHERGYYIATSYNDSNWSKHRNMGVDFNGTQSSVNRIETGNLHNIESVFGFDDFVFTGATESNGVLTFSSEGTLSPDIDDTSYPVAMIDVELWFNGSVRWTAIGEYRSNLTMTSDGTRSVFKTVPIINGSVKFSLSVARGTTIHDIKYKASVC